jgi:uncharacterized DUF497 family protein
MRKFKKSQGFEWDRGNFNKNWLKHKVTNQECEESFFDPNKRILKDDLHSKIEERSILLGKTKKERLLVICFTLRGDKVRVVSARPINSKEQKLYYRK